MATADVSGSDRQLVDGIVTDATKRINAAMGCALSSGLTRDEIRTLVESALADAIYDSTTSRKRRAIRAGATRYDVATGQAAA